MNNQKYILLTIALLIFSGNIFSQDVNNNGAPDSANMNYAYGIQYYIVNGVMFAFKFNNQFPTVWRLKFDLSGTINKSSSFYENFTNNELVSDRESDSEQQIFSIGASFEYNYFFRVHKRFKPYIGIGPLLTYSHGTSEHEYKSDTDQSFSQRSESSSNTYGVGLVAVGGIESELIDFISLFLEYNLSYAYYFHRTEQYSYHPNNELPHRGKASTHQYRLSLSEIKIGVILFF